MRPQHARAIPRAWRHTARIFTALGEPHRQRIVLMFERDERLNVGQIVAASGLSRSAVAHHLKVMRDAGVLHAERIGREVWYRPDADAVRAALAAVRDYLDERFPPGASA
jgi:ArsR family transcriptional regulator